MKTPKPQPPLHAALADRTKKAKSTIEFVHDEPPTWRARLRAGLDKIQPVTRVGERVVTLALQARTLTPLGAFGLASSAINVVREQLGDTTAARPCYSFQIPVGADHLIAAYRKAGADVVEEERKNSDDEHAKIVTLRDGPWLIRVMLNGTCEFKGPPGSPLARVTEVLAAGLPLALRITRSSAGLWQSTEPDLTRYTSAQGKDIAALTAPMLRDRPHGMAILLYGKPGVGKSTMAEEIAAIIAAVIGSGRVVIVGPGCFPPREHSYSRNGNPMSNDDVASSSVALSALAPDIVIADDIDKYEIDLPAMENLRKMARLVIYTANNGANDEVLDAAATRPGRIDETFQVVPVAPLRPPAPFDRLDAVIWERVREWPHAHLNALAQRIEKRGTAPEALRLDDLEQRLKMRTRSGDVLS